MNFIWIYKVAAIMELNLNEIGNARHTRANLHAETGQWASGPRGLPRERGPGPNRGRGQWSSWPTASRRRRRYGRAPARLCSCLEELGRRGEPIGGGAPTERTPELLRRAPTAAEHDGGRCQ